jgi:uncharacterized protein
MKQIKDSNLTPLNCLDGPVIYDTNRVTTYNCDALEAYLLRQNDIDVMADSDQTDSIDAEALEKARSRIERLSRLSCAHGQDSGIASPYSNHPSYLFLNVCNACNLKCTYCYAEDCALANGSQLMSEETVKSSIDFLLNNPLPSVSYSISFAGGEPLLNFNVIKSAVRYAHNQKLTRGINLELKILTNGTLMNAEMLKFISDYNVFVQISLDGPPEIQNQLRPSKRGCGSSEKIFKTIKLFEENGFTNFRVRSTLCHANADIKKIEQFYKGKGLKNYSLQPAMGGEEAPYRLHKEDVHAINAYYDQLSAVACDISKSGASIDIPNDIAVIVEKLALGIKTKRFCGANREMLVVTPDAEFYPCPALVGDRRFRIGDLKHGFYNERDETLPNRPVDEKSVCKKCWARNLCGGGCLAQAVRINADCGIPDPMECAVSKARIKSAIVVYHNLKGRGIDFACHEL